MMYGKHPITAGWGERGIAYVTAILTIVILIFAEITPDISLEALDALSSDIFYSCLFLPKVPLSLYLA